jgi:hypothetical protein
MGLLPAEELGTYRRVLWADCARTMGGRGKVILIKERGMHTAGDRGSIGCWM